MWHGGVVGTDEHPDHRGARFEVLVREELIEPLRRYLRRRTDAATADDVLSETLLVCWRRLDEVPEPALPWAYGVARGCLANTERSARRQRRVAAKVAAVDPPREAQEQPAADPAVHRALAGLRPEDAEVLRLWAWEQLTPAEIGSVLGVTANAASIRLHRARGRLREELGKIGAGAGHEQSERGDRR